MGRTQDIVVAAVISVLVGGLTGYMVESGSNLAVPITSHIVDEMDQKGLVPSIFGYGKEQIKSALRELISILLKGNHSIFSLDRTCRK